MSTKKEEPSFPATNVAKCLNQKAALNIIPKFTLGNISSGNIIEHVKKTMNPYTAKRRGVLYPPEETSRSNGDLFQKNLKAVYAIRPLSWHNVSVRTAELRTGGVTMCSTSDGYLLSTHRLSD